MLSQDRLMLHSLPLVFLQATRGQPSAAAAAAAAVAAGAAQGAWEIMICRLLALDTVHF